MPKGRASAPSIGWLVGSRTGAVLGRPRGTSLLFAVSSAGHEAFAQYPTWEIGPEEDVRARIYQVSCKSCGWRGDACGLFRNLRFARVRADARAVGRGLGQDYLLLLLFRLVPLDS